MPQRTASRKASRRRGGIEPGRGIGQRRAIVHVGAGLDLPDDLELLAQAVVLDRLQAHQVLSGLLCQVGEEIALHGAGGNVGDHVEALPDGD